MTEKHLTEDHLLCLTCGVMFINDILKLFNLDFLDRVVKPERLHNDLKGVAKTRGVPYQDREGEVQATLALMLEEGYLLSGPKPFCFVYGNWNRPIEKQRSRYRRMRKKLPRQLVEEPHNVAPRDLPMSQQDSVIHIRRVTQMAMLSPKETRLIELYALNGITDNAELAKQMGVSAGRIANIKNKALSKLEKLPGVLSMLN